MKVSNEIGFDGDRKPSRGQREAERCVMVPVKVMSLRRASRCCKLRNASHQAMGWKWGAVPSFGENFQLQDVKT